MSDQVSHPFKTTDLIIVLCILILNFWIATWKTKHFSQYYEKFIYSPTDAPVGCIKNNTKIYYRFSIKTAPTNFGAVTLSTGSELILTYCCTPDDGVTLTKKHVGDL